MSMPELVSLFLGGTYRWSKLEHRYVYNRLGTSLIGPRLKQEILIKGLQVSIERCRMILALLR